MVYFNPERQTMPAIGPSTWTGPSYGQNAPSGLALVDKAYRRLVHQPNNPLVVAAYQALAEELWRQFEILFRIRRIEFTNTDPYASSRAMFEALDRGEVLRVYTGCDLPFDHPLAALAPNLQTYNSIFRAVHDGLIHYPNRLNFTAKGELSAFRQHAALLSPLAMWAVATETLGQTAYYTVSGRYAGQKADLLPQSIVADALNGAINENC